MAMPSAALPGPLQSVLKGQTGGRKHFDSWTVSEEESELAKEPEMSPASMILPKTSILKKPILLAAATSSDASSEFTSFGPTPTLSIDGFRSTSSLRFSDSAIVTPSLQSVSIAPSLPVRPSQSAPSSKVAPKQVVKKSLKLPPIVTAPFQETAKTGVTEGGKRVDALPKKANTDDLDEESSEEEVIIRPSKAQPSAPKQIVESHTVDSKDSNESDSDDSPRIITGTVTGKVTGKLEKGTPKFGQVSGNRSKFGPGVNAMGSNDISADHTSGTTSEDTRKKNGFWDSTEALSVSLDKSKLVESPIVSPVRSAESESPEAEEKRKFWELSGAQTSQTGSRVGGSKEKLFPSKPDAATSLRLFGENKPNPFIAVDKKAEKKRKKVEKQLAVLEKQNEKRDKKEQEKQAKPTKDEKKQQDLEKKMETLRLKQAVKEERAEVTAKKKADKLAARDPIIKQQQKEDAKLEKERQKQAKNEAKQGEKRGEKTEEKPTKPKKKWFGKKEDPYGEPDENNMPPPRRGRMPVRPNNLIQSKSGSSNDSVDSGAGNAPPVMAARGRGRQPRGRVPQRQQ
eukprot:Platyproteum_vivax@DN2681_c0_g1_i1.p1